MTLRTHLDGQIFADHLDGRPPAVLALHGWGRSRHDLQAALAGRALIAPDLPGFGASPAPPEAWGAAAYADAIAQMLGECGAGPQLVVGHSFGGRVAAYLAAQQPEMVSGVVFAGTPLLQREGAGASKPPAGYRLVRWLHRRGVVSDKRMDAARQQHGSADYKAAEGIIRDVLVRVVNEDYGDQLARITCPVGFCWGELDTAAPPEVAGRASAMVANLVVVDVVDGAGHDVHRQAPERLAAVVDAVAGEGA